MEGQVTREIVIKHLKNVEHPEIALSLFDLGMILDVMIEQNTAKVAIALPMLNIPQAIANAILQSIHQSIKTLGLQLKPVFFEMTPEMRDNFFRAAKANWKGTI